MHIYMAIRFYYLPFNMHHQLSSQCIGQADSSGFKSV